MEGAVTDSEAEFLKSLKTKSGMPDAKERRRLREILGKRQRRHIFSWVEAQKTPSTD
jgi:hypothetical protein